VVDSDVGSRHFSIKIEKVFLKEGQEGASAIHLDGLLTNSRIFLTVTMLLLRGQGVRVVMERVGVL
jgi:hypothetical protein